MCKNRTFLNVLYTAAVSSCNFLRCVLAYMAKTRSGFHEPSRYLGMTTYDLSRQSEGCAIPYGGRRAAAGSRERASAGEYPRDSLSAQR
jgi:hypothetical protein